MHGMKKHILRILLLLWFIFILKETVFRSGFLQYPLFSNGNFNLEMFSDLISVYRHNVYTFIYLCVGNIVTFIPFGFLVLPLFRGKNNRAFLLTLLFGFLLSLTIELAQWAFGVGVSEIDDLILNTFGVALGALLCLPFRKRLTGCRLQR